MKEEYVVVLRAGEESVLTFRYQEPNLPDGWYLKIGATEFHMHERQVISSIRHLSQMDKDRIKTLRTQLENSTNWQNLQPPTFGSDGKYHLTTPKQQDINSRADSLNFVANNAPTMYA